MNTPFYNKNKNVILIKNNEYITVNYYYIDAIKNLIQNTKILTNPGYKYYYIDQLYKL
jgi:hypothetical protein